MLCGLGFGIRFGLYLSYLAIAILYNKGKSKERYKENNFIYKYIK
jgi:hypothetical protein